MLPAVPPVAPPVPPVLLLRKLAAAAAALPLGGAPPFKAILYQKSVYTETIRFIYGIE
ncbi:hypothetical protein Hanom_Chr16g01490871 [Helianthus anomalus]